MGFRNYKRLKSGSFTHKENVSDDDPNYRQNDGFLESYFRIQSMLNLYK